MLVLEFQRRTAVFSHLDKPSAGGQLYFASRRKAKSLIAGGEAIVHVMDGVLILQLGCSEPSGPISPCAITARESLINAGVLAGNVFLVRAKLEAWKQHASRHHRES